MARDQDRTSASHVVPSLSPGRTIPQPFRAAVEQVASASAGLLFSMACHLALLLAVGGVWEAFLYGVRSVSFAGTERTRIKCAADTKRGGVSGRQDGCAAIVRDLERLETWSERHLMRSDNGRGKVHHQGRSHPSVTPGTGGEAQGSTLALILSLSS